MDEHAADEQQDLRIDRLLVSTKRGCTALKVVAIVLATGAVVGSFISATTDMNQFYGGPEIDLPGKVKFAQFAQGVIPNLIWSALLFVAAIAISLCAAWLSRKPDTTTDPVVPPSRPAPPDGPLDDRMWRP